MEGLDEYIVVLRVELIFSVDPMYPYFLIGFAFACVKDRAPKWIINLKYLSFVFFPVMLLFYQKQYYIYISGVINRQYEVFTMIGINLFRWGIGLFGSIFVLVLLEWFVIAMKKVKMINLLGNAVSKIGQKSMQIYCFSVSMLSFFLPKVYSAFCEKVVGYNLFSQNMSLYNFVFTPLIAICYAVGLYWLIKLLEKIKVSKVIFGR